MKERLFKVIKIYLILSSIFVIYYFINKYTNFYIPCIFRLITGYKCPGCGITHLLFHLINLDFNSAFIDNPLIFIYIPFIGVYFIYLSYIYIYNKENKLNKIPNYYLIIIIIITIIYGVIRNIYNF